MSEFVKRGAFNNYKSVSGGWSDPECTHVILERKEYARLLHERDQYKKDCKDVQDEADRAVQQEVSRGRKQLRQVREQAEKVLDQARKELAAALDDAAYQRRLNENLLRICRERANADRKLKPKKQHPGFLVVTSAEREYRYRSGRAWKTVRLWETLLQSPYSVEFTEEQARKLITESFLKEDGTGDRPNLMEMLGIQGSYSCKYEALLQDPEAVAQASRQNIMLEQRLRANYRTGYWEVQFFHTRALGQIPQDMRR